MRDIAIFHHVHQYGDWEKIYTEQVVALQQSGLYDAATYRFIGINGDKSLPFNLEKTNKICQNKTGDQSTEYVTIKALYDYCYLKNAHVLFLHTKGVSWSLPEEQNNTMNLLPGVFTIKQIYDASQLWRKYFEFFLVKNWRRCIELLKDYDSVGTEWKDHSVIQDVRYEMPHYSGGMWWANSEYIRKLDASFITNNYMIGRYATELWIGTKNPKMFSFYDSGRNLYLEPIEQKEYENRV